MEINNETRDANISPYHRVFLDDHHLKVFAGTTVSPCRKKFRFQLSAVLTLPPRDLGVSGVNLLFGKRWQRMGGGC